MKSVRCTASSMKNGQLRWRPEGTPHKQIKSTRWASGSMYFKALFTLLTNPQRGAQPLERLRKCHRRFQRRLIESIQKTVNDPSAAAATARAPASKTSRAPLGRLSRPSQRATSIAASSTGGKTSASRGKQQTALSSLEKRQASYL